jgi:gliding motility-associated-like protein
LPSFIETNTYFSEDNGSFDALDPRFGVLSIAINTPDTNWFNTIGATAPLVHVEYFENKQQKLEGYATLYKPQNESWLTKQKGFYVTIDDRRGFGCNFEGPIFNDPGLGATSRTVFPTLHVNAGDFESHSAPGTSTTGLISYGTGIRDVFLQSLASKYNLKVNPLHMKPLITFVNGKYMGAYDLREVYDKFYENYYNGQPKDSCYMNLFNFVDASVFNPIDGTTSSPTPLNLFKTEVYDWTANHAGAMTSPSFYGTLMNRLDKESFIDYFILNSYAMNSSLWNTNVAYAKGASKSKPGNKWHYYLWNAPSTFTFNALATNTLVYNSQFTSPCPNTYTVSYPNSALAGNSHGNIFRILMNPITGNPSFQLDYKNRYQDLLNGALKCENILAHYDYVVSLFRKEMKYHESTSSTPLGNFTTADDLWDTNTYHLRKIIEKRCDWMRLAFGTAGCYGMYGPYPVSVDVFPSGAGTVKLNSIVLPNYIWDGQYYSTQLSFKAAPTSTNYVFHHWEFKNHIIKNNDPLSKDSLAIDFNQPETVLAVFTDVTLDIDIPTGFSPNGDGQNEEFKPMGSALFSKEYDFRIWNRWGQEIFRSTDPNIGWDGYFDGKQAQTGVYAYVITYKNVYNESKIKKGNVTLVR